MDRQTYLDVLGLMAVALILIGIAQELGYFVAALFAIATQIYVDWKVK